ncbi:hypothetical protein BG011_010143 [Mortierella polycephala]|uniref:Extracellular membrane protein CFEM domain-containing protein n=1 Tax=Mortierella polycephala TaxID=41804 RepID=A0A9P6PLY8_9FUNG|nr:hypothetical protein BG011_010143 [Mortierella polycephala]
MMLKNLAVVACLATAAVAQQVSNIFCQARYATNIVTCIIGVKECNVVEAFSACVCSNTGNRENLRHCMVALLSNPSFRGILGPRDFASLDSYSAEFAAVEKTEEEEKKIQVEEKDDEGQKAEL